MAANPAVDAIKSSFLSSIGDIVFGMEDGTVSIFGLVFGVAASATSSHIVLLAGATGAAAAAIAMMAGTYLDVKTSQGQARVQIAGEREHLATIEREEAHELDARLQARGFDEQERRAVIAALRAHPETWLRVEAAFEYGLGDIESRNPVVQALWMLVADAFAAAIPVIPFALLPLASARIVSIIITGLLLVLLGIGRARVARTNLPLTVIETVGIATAAAIAGLLIGKLVTSV